LKGVTNSVLLKVISNILKKCNRLNVTKSLNFKVLKDITVVWYLNVQFNINNINSKVQAIVLNLELERKKYKSISYHTINQ
jgi:hypothetical protein